MSNLQPPTPGLIEPLPPMDGQGPDTAKADPFNPETLRIGVTANIEVEQVQTAVPVRKPKRTEFFRRRALASVVGLSRRTAGNT